MTKETDTFLVTYFPLKIVCFAEYLRTNHNTIISQIFNQSIQGIILNAFLTWDVLARLYNFRKHLQKLWPDSKKGVNLLTTCIYFMGKDSRFSFLSSSFYTLKNVFCIALAFTLVLYCLFIGDIHIFYLTYLTFYYPILTIYEHWVEVWFFPTSQVCSMC